MKHLLRNIPWTVGLAAARGLHSLRRNVVVSNLSDSVVKCRLTLKDLQPKAVTSYTTTLKKHLQPQQLTPSVNEYELDALSVTTLVFEL